MPDLYSTANQFRADLLRRERTAATEMVRAYGTAWQRIRQQLSVLDEQIAGARLRGEEVHPGWLFQADRLQTLQRQVEHEIGQFARFADSTIRAEQSDAVQAALDNAEHLVQASLGTLPPGVTMTLAKLPREALADLIGFLSDGSPLSDLLDELGPDASAAIRKALITGLATGQSMAAIARTIRHALGGNLVRALTIARTETLRSYRESSRRIYQANSDVVKGWTWQSARTVRTCVSCWAMDGTFHTLDEQLDDHPRGRCTMVPVTKTWRELGYPNVEEVQQEIPPGIVAFGQLSETQQEQILGPSKFAAFREGRIRLADLAGEHRNPRWGAMRYERSLKDALAVREQLMRETGGGETVFERVARLVESGQIPRDAVESGDRYWQGNLQSPIRISNGEQVRVTLADFYHAFVVPRIGRQPVRIRRALDGIFEIRSAPNERQVALSRWSETEGQRFAILTLDPDGSLRSIILTSDDRRIKREQRHGDVRWKS